MVWFDGSLGLVILVVCGLRAGQVLSTRHQGRASGADVFSLTVVGFRPPLRLELLDLDSRLP